MTRKLSCPPGSLPPLAYPEKPVKTRVPLKQFTGNLLADAHCARLRQRGEAETTNPKAESKTVSY